MTCYSCGGNPETWCQQCLPADDTWIAPVDKLPDVFMGDRDHLYMTPDGNFWALSPDRTKWMKVNGQGSNYTAGDGIRIDGSSIVNTKPNKDQSLSVTDHRLSISDGNTVNLPNDKQNLSVNGRTLAISGGNSVTIPDDKQSLSINGRTVTISGGNSITLPEDRDTVYNDAELKRRIQAVEQRTDNFVTGVAVSRNGNKVKLTYTFVNGAPKEVEFEDKDTVTLAYDDSALKARVKALENKTDKDGQTLSVSGNTLSISGGNSVTLPIPVAQTPVEVAVADGLTVTKAGNKYTVSSKALLDRITALERKPDNDAQRLSLSGNTLSLTNGGSVTLPTPATYNDTDIKRRLTALEGKTDKDTVYNDTEVKRRLTVLESKPDKDEQTITFNNFTRDLNISRGNTVKIPQQGTNLLNHYCGEGILLKLGETQDYIVSKWFKLRDGKTLRELGFSSGNKITISFAVETNGVATDGSDLIRAEWYTSSPKPSNYINLLGQIQTLVAGKTYTYEHTLVEKDLNSNSICIRVDNYYQRKGRVRIKDFMVYSSEYKPTRYLPTTGTKEIGRFNYLKGTTTLSTNAPGRDIRDVEGVKAVFAPTNIPNGSSKYDIISIPLDKPITTGFYTFGFMAKADKNTQVITHLFNPNRVEGVASNTEVKVGEATDGYCKVTIDDGFYKYYEVTYAIYAPEPIKPTVLIKITQGGRNLSVKLPYFVDYCGTMSWVSHPDDGKQTLSLSGNTLNLSDGGTVQLPQTTQSLSVNGRTLSISRGNNVTIPDTTQPIFRIAKNDISGSGSVGSTASTTLSNLMNPDGIKVGDIVQDFFNATNNSQMGYFKVTSVNGQNVNLQGLGFHETTQAPTMAQYNDLNNRFNALKADYDRAIQALHKIVSNLQSSGAWTGGITGQFVNGRNIATGNINLFGGTADGNYFIRTNNGRTENDLAGGIN